LNFSVFNTNPTVLILGAKKIVYDGPQLTVFTILGKATWEQISVNEVCIIFYAKFVRLENIMPQPPYRAGSAHIDQNIVHLKKIIKEESGSENLD
jgi:hypothetical protein